MGRKEPSAAQNCNKKESDNRASHVGVLKVHRCDRRETQTCFMWWKSSYSSHPPVVVVLISISWLDEGKSAVVASQVAGQANQHLRQTTRTESTLSQCGSSDEGERASMGSHFSKRGVNVKEEGPVDVVASHLPEVCLVPAETHQRLRRNSKTFFNFPYSLFQANE